MTAHVDPECFSDEDWRAIHAWADIALAESRPVLPGEGFILLPDVDMLHAEANHVALDPTWCLERADGREVYVFRLPDGWDQ